MNRDLNIDSLKGFLIVLVVVGHIPFGIFNIEKVDSLKYFTQWIYFFHMPLFLAVSVLYIKDSYSWFFKRASLILIPYLFWFFYGHKRMLIENPIEFMGGVLMGNWSTLNSILWFLPALFSLNLLFFIFNKSNKFFKYALVFLSFLIFLFANKIVNYHNDIPFGIDVALYLFILGFLTRLVYQNKNIVLRKTNSKVLVLTIIVSSVFLFIYEPVKTHTQWHSIVDFAQFSVATTYLGYLSFLVLNISIIILFLKIKFNQHIQYIGLYSFPIFILHLIVLYKLPNYFLFDSVKLNVFLVLLTFIVSILIPIVISKLLMKISNKFQYVGMVK